MTINSFNKGKAVYQAARDRQSLKSAIIDMIIQESGVTSVVDSSGVLPHGVTAHSRTDGENLYIFVENYSCDESATVKLRKKMKNMLTGEFCEICEIAPYGFAIFKEEH